MVDSSLYKDATKAMALGQSDRARELGDQVLQQDSEHLIHFVNATAFLVVDEYFQDDQNLDTIKNLAEEMRLEFAEADPPLNPLAIEGFVRAVLGENHLLESIAIRDQYSSGVALIRKIAHESGTVRQQLDEILDEAAELAAEWHEQAKQARNGLT